MTFDFPEPDVEAEIVAHEAGIDVKMAERLVQVADFLRDPMTMAELMPPILAMLLGPPGDTNPQMFHAEVAAGTWPQVMPLPSTQERLRATQVWSDDLVDTWACAVAFSKPPHPR